jgi:hypothetical protein
MAETTWRYGVTREMVDGEESWSIREVYIGSDGQIFWTYDPIPAVEMSWRDLSKALDLMVEALTLPVLDLTVDPPAYFFPMPALIAAEAEASEASRDTPPPPGVVPLRRQGVLSDLTDPDVLEALRAKSHAAAVRAYERIKRRRARENEA